MGEFFSLKRGRKKEDHSGWPWLLSLIALNILLTAKTAKLS
jgi:hypothetical protein